MQKLDKRIAVLLVLLLLFPFIYNQGYHFLTIVRLDYATFYFGSRLAFHEQASPYDYALLAETAESVIGERPLAYLYPPPSLFIFYPLGVLSFRASSAIMSVFIFFLILILILLLFRILGYNLSTNMGIFSFAYAASFYGLTANLEAGQINLLVIVLICGSWLLFKEDKRAFWIALPLAIATLIKVYPALFILYFAAKRRWMIVTWTIVCLLIFSIASYFILPSIFWSEWITTTLATGGYSSGEAGILSPADWENQSIHGFITRLCVDERFSEPLIAGCTIDRLFGYLFSIVGIGVFLGLTFWIKSPIGTAVTDSEFALGLLTMVLASPLSWSPHMVFVLPAALVALRLALREKSSFIALSIGILTLFIAWRMPFVTIARVLPSSLLPLGVSIRFYAMVCLWAYLAIKLWKAATAEHDLRAAHQVPAA
jgi:alpha-1,2-mannosyltransferase